VMAGYISYSFERVGEICESINQIDRIMATGFNWAPPSALVDLMGPSAAVRMLAEAGVSVPPVLANADENVRFFHHPNMNTGKFLVAG